MQAEKTNIKPFWNKGSIEGLLSLVEKRCWTGVVTPCHLLPLLHAGRFMCKCTMGMVQARRYVSKQALWLTCKGSVWFGPSVLKLYPAGKHCFHYTMALPPHSLLCHCSDPESLPGHRASLTKHSFSGHLSVWVESLMRRRERGPSARCMAL